MDIKMLKVKKKERKINAYRVLINTVQHYHGEKRVQKETKNDNECVL